MVFCSGVPLLLLVGAIAVFAWPAAPILESARIYAYIGLGVALLSTCVSGAYLIWDVRRAVVRGMTAASELAPRLKAVYTGLEATNAQLRESSFKDDLTGLYNRRFLYIRLDEEMSRYRRFNRPLAVVLMDLDGFKAVNDEMGHVVGDDALREIGQILVKNSRGINVASRYGGDEFALLLVETSREGAVSYANRIRQIIDGSLLARGKSITASFGVASLPEDAATTSEDLIRAADRALYAAKAAGRNTVAATPLAPR